MDVDKGEKIKITDVIEKLKSILESNGNLPVCSPGYHSDYLDAQIEHENINDCISVVNDRNDKIEGDEDEEEYLLIYGGYS